MSENKLVTSNRKKNGLLSRGPSIQPKEKFDIGNLNESKAAPVTSNKIEYTYEPKPTSMKIDSDLRDKLNALSLIGFAETQKEVVQQLIINAIEELPEEMRRSFDFQYDVLREKTIKKMKR